VERQKYGMAVGELSARALAAVEAAETTRARTVIYRDKTPVAAIMPIDDLEAVEPSDPAEAGPDPLLSLCGSCRQDVFADSMLGDFGKTMLFRRG